MKKFIIRAALIGVCALVIGGVLLGATLNALADTGLNWSAQYWNNTTEIGDANPDPYRRRDQFQLGCRRARSVLAAAQFQRTLDTEPGIRRRRVSLPCGSRRWYPRHN